MKNKKVLLTGGAGFIGTKLTERYSEDNEIYIYDSLRRNSLKSTNLERKDSVHLIEGDILDAEKLKKVVKDIQPTHIVHLAAIAGIDTVIKHPIDTMTVNIVGLYNMLEAVRPIIDRVERFIDISTSEVFGTQAFRVEEKSNTNLAPVGEARWTYSISKLAGEHFANAYYKELGLKSVSIRPFNIYGPGQVGEGAIHQFVINAINNKDICIHGDGDQIRSWCYITDFVEGLGLCLDNDKAVGESFNIGNPRGTITISMLARMIKELANSSSKITYVDKYYADVELRIPSISKAKEMLDFSPKVDLEAGLLKTIEWYRTRG